MGVPSVGGEILGLLAPVTGVAVSSPVAEFDPSGLVRTGPACHSIVRQSGSQSEAHTALGATDGPWEPLTPVMFRRDPSCGRAHAPAHTHAHTDLRVAFRSPLLDDRDVRDGDLSSGQPHSPVSLSPQPNAEPLDNRCTERKRGSDSQLRACDELPEIIVTTESDRSRLDSVDTVPRLVDDDTSSGEESEDESRQSASTIDSARAQWKPTGKSVCVLLHATDIDGR